MSEHKFSSIESLIHHCFNTTELKYLESPRVKTVINSIEVLDLTNDFTNKSILLIRKIISELKHQEQNPTSYQET